MAFIRQSQSCAIAGNPGLLRAKPGASDGVHKFPATELFQLDLSAAHPKNPVNMWHQRISGGH